MPNAKPRASKPSVCLATLRHHQSRLTHPDRKFDTLVEAEAFVKGSSPSTAKSSASPPIKLGKNKFYGVAIGHVPGVYSDWTSVQAQIKGCVGAKQKAFATSQEALAWVNTHKRDPSVPISLRGHLSEASSAAEPGHKIGDRTPKKQKKTDRLDVVALPAPGAGPLPPGAEDGFDRTIIMDLQTGAIRHKNDAELSVTKLQPTGDSSGPIVVYTDGSALGNGKKGAIAGVGVYFGPNDSR
jgi:ribonuclease HI